MRKIKYIFLILCILVFGSTITSCDLSYDTTSDSSIETEKEEDVLVWVCVEVEYNEDDYKKCSLYNVYIDDEKVGKVSVDEHKFFELVGLTGKHKIYVEHDSLFAHEKSSEKTFVVSSDHCKFAYKITEKSFINPSLKEIETETTIAEKRQRENTDKSKETTAPITTEIGDNIIKDAYKEVLNACNQENTENDLIYREYYITDINNDNIPEMILFLGDNIESATLGIYTFKNNKPYDCGWFSTGINVNNEDELQYVSENSQYIISKGDNCIYNSFCYNGYQHTNIISLDENMSADISEYYDSGTEKLSDYDIPGEHLESSDCLDDSLLSDYFS